MHLLVKRNFDVIKMGGTKIKKKLEAVQEEFSVDCLTLEDGMDGPYGNVKTK